MSKFKYSKRYRKISQKIETNKHYSLADALRFLQENNTEKSSNIELAFSFYWNEKKLPLRTSLTLPHQAKKIEKIAVISDEEAPFYKKNIDLDTIELINVEELKQRIKAKKTKWGFQKLLAHTSYQDKIKALAKVLGPKKMFPNSKDGTLTTDLATTIEEIQKGKVEIKTDKHGNVHVLLGKADFSLSWLEKNYQVLYNAIINLKPTNWKGEYLRNITLSTTMSPGIRVLF